MKRRKHLYDFSNATIDLQNAGFQTKVQTYGFSVILQDSKTEYYVECGHVHEGGISISVNSGTPPVRWFVRPSIQEWLNF